MKSHSWNISNPEGETLLEKLLLSILHHQSKMTIGEIGTKLKEKATADQIVFYRNGKRRNINQYIRTKFSGIYNFLSSRPSQFIVIPIEKTNNQYHVSLTSIVVDDLNKEEAENDDFIWVSSGEL